MSTKNRVMVVEEDKYLTSGIRDILELEDYHVLASLDAYAARLALPSYRPELLVIGYSISSNKHYDDLIADCQYLFPCVFIASRSSSEILSTKPFYNKADPILIKPFDAEELLEAISRLLQH